MSLLYEDELKGKNVIITGGGRGIGKAVADLFLQLGANVTVVRISTPSEDSEQIDIKGQLTVFGDASEEMTAKKTIDLMLSNFGLPDILVNNVGVWQKSPVEDMTLSLWNYLIDSNLKSAYLFVRATTPLLKKRGKGSIINISSISGLIGNAEMTAYNAAKFGMVGFTKGLAQELAPYGIRVNAICPGDVDTDMFTKWVDSYAVEKKITSNEVLETICRQIPLGRVASPIEIAHVVIFLASSFSSYITGAIIPVTGGKYGL